MTSKPAEKKVRVVLDTNLFVAALFNKRSASHTILSNVKQGTVVFLWTDATRKETERVVDTIIRAAGRGKRKELLDDTFAAGEYVSSPPRIRYIKDDPTDDKFLACAVKGKADYIISNDEHLRAVGEFQGIPVVTPTQFLKAVKERGVGDI